MVMLDVEEQATSIRFEDATWQDYMPTLKPLGLNFILNANCWSNRSDLPTGAHLQWKPTHTIPPMTRSVARQTCLCRIATEIGFIPNAIQKFKRHGELWAAWHQQTNVYLSTTESYKSQPSLTASIYEALDSSTFQLLSEGEPGIILACCADYWDGQCLMPMNEEMTRRLMDFQQTAMMNDLACIAFAYRPMTLTELEENGDTLVNTTNTPVFCILSSPTEPLTQPVDDYKTSSNLVQLLDKQIFLGYATLLLQPKAVSI
jgi:hypothetical protein